MHWLLGAGSTLAWQGPNNKTKAPVEKAPSSHPISSHGQQTRSMAGSVPCFPMSTFLCTITGSDWGMCGSFHTILFGDFPLPWLYTSVYKPLDHEEGPHC